MCRLCKICPGGRAFPGRSRRSRLPLCLELHQHLQSLSFLRICFLWTPPELLSPQPQSSVWRSGASASSPPRQLVASQANPGQTLEVLLSYTLQETWLLEAFQLLCWLGVTGFKSAAACLGWHSLCPTWGHQAQEWLSYKVTTGRARVTGTLASLVEAIVVFSLNSFFNYPRGCSIYILTD